MEAHDFLFPKMPGEGPKILMSRKRRLFINKSCQGWRLTSAMRYRSSEARLLQKATAQVHYETSVIMVQSRVRYVYMCVCIYLYTDI